MDWSQSVKETQKANNEDLRNLRPDISGGTPEQYGKVSWPITADGRTYTPQEREQEGQLDQKSADNFRTGTRQPSSIKAPKGENMQFLSGRLQAGSKEQRQTENLLQGMQVCTCRSNTARDEFIKWQSVMRSALSGMPTGYAQWIWEPIDDVDEKQGDLF